MLDYRILQTANLVSAVAVGHITSRLAYQFVMLKKELIEVWEVDASRQRKALSASMKCALVDCAILQAPFVEASAVNAEHLNLDLLLVLDIQGRLSVLGWDGSTGLRQSCGGVQVENHSTVTTLHSRALFSRALILSKEGTACSSYGKGARSSGCKDRGLEVQLGGITLVGFSHDATSLQVLVVEWTSVGDAEQSVTSISRARVATWAVCLNLVEMMQCLIAPNTSEGPRSNAIILDVAFIGSTISNTGSPGSVVDSKGRPLIGILSADHGRLYPLSSGCAHQPLSVQCFALELSTMEIVQGPWKMSNLHPTTTFLLPWFYQSTRESLEMCQDDEAPVDTGLEPGLGILLISSTSLFFIESTGRRMSLAVSLEGLPTCYDSLNEQRLIIGDSSGTLHIFDLSEWHNHQMQRITFEASPSAARIVKDIQLSPRNGENLAKRDRLFYLCNFLGKSDVYTLHSSLEKSPPASEESRPSISVPREDSMGSTLSSGFSAITWTAKKLVVEASFLQTIAPVKDALSVSVGSCDTGLNLLVVTGSAPTSKLQRGDLAVVFIEDDQMDLHIPGLPLLLPFKIRWESASDTHLLVSYPVQNVSSVIALAPNDAPNPMLDAIDRCCSTLAIALFQGDLLVQATRASVRVLSVSGWRVFKAEWTPPKDNNLDVMRQNNLSHAAFGSDGAALARGQVVYALQLDRTGGMPHTTAISHRPQQVSALSIFTLKGSSPVIVVILGLWMTNTVMILSWPLLDDLSCICTDGGPIRSLSGATFRDNHYVCAGTADGFLMCYKLTTSCSTDKSKCSDDRQFKDNTEGCQKSTFNWSIVSGQRLKTGNCETKLMFGSFGKQGDRFSAEVDQTDCLIVHSDELLVLLLPEKQQNLQAVTVHDLAYPYRSLARFQVNGQNSALVLLTTDGQLVFGHLDMHVSLRWRASTLPGSAGQLAYHSTSNCTIVSSMEESGASTLAIFQLPSMSQVLGLDLGNSLHLILLKVVKLPSLFNEEVIWKEYLILVCEQVNHSAGHLFLFDLRVSKPADGETQYEMTFLGKHGVDLPCYSMCVLNLPEDFSYNGNRCSTEQGHRMKLLHEDRSRELIERVQSAAILAVGSKGRVQLLSCFVAHTGVSLSLLAALSGALDAALPSPDAYVEQLHEAVDKDEPSSATDFWEGCEATEPPFLHPSKSKTCLMNLQHIVTFSTTGGGYVTELIPGFEATLTVVEYLHGVGIYRVLGRGKVLQLVWQAFPEPIQALLPLSDDLYLVASHGLCLLQRDRAAEIRFQEDVEREAGVVPDGNGQEPDADNQEQSLSVEVENSQTQSLPGLHCLATCPVPSSALRMFGLDAHAHVLSNKPDAWTAVIVAPNGEVGVLTVAEPPLQKSQSEDHPAAR